jgi:hypothetical protein
MVYRGYEYRKMASGIYFSDVNYERIFANTIMALKKIIDKRLEI